MINVLLALIVNNRLFKDVRKSPIIDMKVMLKAREITMENEILSKRIREARRAKGFTQEELAEKAGISVVYVSEIERNLKTPSIEVFSHIALALEVSADYLLRDTLPTGKEYVYDELTQKLEGLTPRQRKTVADLIDAYLNSLS